MIFWTSALQVAAKMDRMKLAEARLLALAKKFGDRNAYEYKITTFDTTIPRKVVPLKPTGCDDDAVEEELVLHAVRVQSTTSTDDHGTNKKTTKTPLVLMHGYMNASAYFYRNLIGLSHYFETIYSLDMLGWGLSSRPNFDLLVSDDSKNSTPEQQELDKVKTAEQFFVESLEAWRERNGIDKMILAGHSMGGYMSVAYCEQYPERVEKLILLSPVGVPEESEETKERRIAMRHASWRYWAMSGVAQNIYHYQNPAKFFRTLPSSWGEKMTKSYVEKRLPAISDPDEQTAIAEYLMANNALPGSGEHCLNSVLNPFAFAKRPLEYRIPLLKVPSVTFVYGSNDWMNPEGGVIVQKKCQDLVARNEAAPDVSVYQVSNAGHLLMLENWKEFNAGVILGAGGSLDCLPGNNTPMPTLMSPAEMVKDQPTTSGTSGTVLKEQNQRTSTASLSDASI